MAISSERRASELYTGQICLCGSGKSSHSYACRGCYFDLPDDVRKKLHSLTLVEAMDSIRDELGLSWPAEGEVF